MPPVSSRSRSFASLSSSAFSFVLRKGFAAVVCLLTLFSLLTCYAPAPVLAVSQTVVISELRTRGPNGGNDEFIELYNASAAPVAIGGWKVNGSNATGTISTRATITAGKVINPGCHYLLTNTATGGYNGSVAGDQTYGTGVTDDGGVAILNSSNVIVDQVGFSLGSTYKEGAILPTQLTTNVNRSYERKPGGSGGSATDTDNNATDFTLISPSDPQNSSSTCITGSTAPTGVGSATPNSLHAGDTVLLTVQVTPGTSPASTGLAVTADLSSIGGSAAQQFSDNGTNGDATAGDQIFSFQTAVATSAGSKSITATITDAQARSTTASIALTVTLISTSPTGVGSATPSSLQEGNTTLLTVAVAPGTNPVSTGIGVVGDLHLIGGLASQQFYDDGSHGDATPNDSVFSFQIPIASGTSPGAKSLPVVVGDAQGRSNIASVSLTVQAPPPPKTVKISQVYGGGGNSGSTYTHDFIEIFNQSQTPVDLSQWSVQYNSASATNAWQTTNLCPTNGSCILLPGHYYLVRESQGAGGTTPLPTADAVGADAGILISGTNGKVALVANTVALSGACPASANIVDLVGYGSATCFETAATPTLSNTTAAVRKGNGCVDTDNNLNDFVVVGPIPRNSASPANSCGGDPTQPSGLGIASPGSLDPASNTLLTVKVTPATTPPSTNLVVGADLSTIGGQASQPFYDDATHGDQTAGDNVFSFQATVGPFIPTGVKTIVATITDAENRTAAAPITLTVASPTCGVERWSVKTGTDPDALLVNLANPISGVIADLGAINAPVDPPGPPSNARVLPTESTVYVVNGTMTFYKKEGDVDYHIVVQDGGAEIHSLIAEIPSPACVGPTSPFGPAVAAARAKFDARFPGVNGFFQVANIPVQIKGVGFFDFIHGQTGVALNGIELHPVLEINFTANTITTLSSGVSPSQYGQPVAITAMVTNGSATIPTGNVTFFDGATPAGNVALDATGNATLTINGLSAGSHSFTASYEGDSTSAPSTSAALLQVVNKADQSIDFGALTGKTYGAADFTVSAAASSGLDVGFSIVSGAATISGSTVHITGAGTVTIRASQAGDSNYNAATDIDQSFEVAKAGQTITFAPLATKTFGDAAFSVAAGGGASGNPVIFVAVGNCTSTGSDGSNITITGAGSCTVTALQTGDANYKAAQDVPQSFAINKANANVTVNGYSGVYDGQDHGASGSATGVNGENLGTMLNLGASFTDVPGGTAHWTFAGNANYPASSGDASIAITKATPSFSNLSSPVITVGTVSTSLTGNVSLGTLIPTGSIEITLNGVTQNATIQAGGGFSANFATGSLAAVNPPYAIAYNYGGDGNFNPAAGAGTLTVSYGVTPLFDQAKAAKSGSTIPIKIMLVNSAGADVSSASIAVTAVQLVQTSGNATSEVQDSGNANPDNNFRFDGNGYIFNLSTKGLATGTWQLFFTVAGDSVRHSVLFQVR